MPKTKKTGQGKAKKPPRPPRPRTGGSSGPIIKKPK